LSKKKRRMTVSLKEEIGRTAAIVARVIISQAADTGVKAGNEAMKIADEAAKYAAHSLSRRWDRFREFLAVPPVVEPQEAEAAGAAPSEYGRQAQGSYQDECRNRV
jgi:hypothetical protein